MIINSNKFKSIVIQKSNQRIKPKEFLIENDVVEIASSVSLLRPSNLKYFLDFEERKFWLNSCLITKF